MIIEDTQVRAGQKYIRKVATIACCTQGIVEKVITEEDKITIIIRITKCTQGFKGVEYMHLKEFEERWELIRVSKIIKVI